ncbi:14313_t:CDS:2 [Funneliformis mosseae]|uniref:14313_t:CDS:1 n=1 Tax=Funneliformis mosseae TaxID=27381 RepID=A0A9N9HD05_FUNMO|nr:14313_t:CDS:2 [Funneliformis mosseae]
MSDSVSHKPPQGVKTSDYKFEIIVTGPKASIQDSVQVANTIKKEPQMTSTSGTSNNDASFDTQEEVDLMNFDEDYLNFDFNNYATREVDCNVQHISTIDQLLCDLDFGRDILFAKANYVPEDEITQNKQITSKLSEQLTHHEIPVKDNNKMRSPYKPTDVPSVSSLMKEVQLSEPSLTTNGTLPKDAIRTYISKETQTISSSRVDEVATKLTYTTKGTQTDIFVPATETIYQKPKKRIIYSFVELLIYQFSPLTKELHDVVGRRFNRAVIDYDLLQNSSQSRNNQPRYPGVQRGTIIPPKRYGRYGALDPRYENDRFAASPIRKHFESPSELSFLKECVSAHNRWIALLREKELRLSCLKEFKECKSMKWINAHMSLTNEHSENCLTHKMGIDQQIKANSHEKDHFEEEDGH